LASYDAVHETRLHATSAQETEDTFDIVAIANLIKDKLLEVSGQ